MANNDSIHLEEVDLEKLRKSFVEGCSNLLFVEQLGKAPFYGVYSTRDGSNHSNQLFIMTNQEAAEDLAKAIAGLTGFTFIGTKS